MSSIVTRVLSMKINISIRIQSSTNIHIGISTFNNFHPGGRVPSGTGGDEGSWSQQLLHLHFRFSGCFVGGNWKP